MRDGSECEQLADECRKLATTAASPEHKKMLEEMAAAWEKLAEGCSSAVSERQQVR
jgi:hypothetical protein